MGNHYECDECNKYMGEYGPPEEAPGHFCIECAQALACRSRLHRAQLAQARAEVERLRELIGGIRHSAAMALAEDSAPYSRDCLSSIVRRIGPVVARVEEPAQGEESN